MARAFAGVAAFVVLGALAVGATAAPGSQTKAQQVTLIGDSVADAIAQTTTAAAEVGREVSLNLQATPCRRVAGDSCPYNGVRPPNVIQLAQSLGPALGPNVVVAVGYNDFENTFAQDIQSALSALESAGAKRIFWLTLRAARHPYLTMNADLESAAASHPDLTIVDWNVYSRSHPDWFQSDGIHLNYAGAMAMATLIHKALEKAGVAAPDVRVKTATLPVASRGAAYSAQLLGAAGIAPYRWSLLERAPGGIHLQANGVVRGRPRVAAGAYTFNVRITDSTGASATRRLTLRVR
jgi:lysophospholipase L1-like esterase